MEEPIEEPRNPEHVAFITFGMACLSPPQTVSGVPVAPSVSLNQCVGFPTADGVCCTDAKIAEVSSTLLALQPTVLSTCYEIRRQLECSLACDNTLSEWWDPIASKPHLCSDVCVSYWTSCWAQVRASHRTPQQMSAQLHVTGSGPPQSLVPTGMPPSMLPSIAGAGDTEPRASLPQQLHILQHALHRTRPSRPGGVLGAVGGFDRYGFRGWCIAPLIRQQ